MTADNREYCPKHPRMSPGGIDCCKACDKLQALAELRALLPPGSTVYTILRSVSRSGMSRVITPLVLTASGPRFLTYAVASALGLPVKRGFVDGLRIDGGGMDMGFHLVSSLSYALHGMTQRSDTTERPGYTLTHRWL